MKELIMEEKVVKEVSIYDIPGVGTATAEKLVDSGFDELLPIAVATPNKLVDTAGVTESTARKMIKFARDALDMGFESGEALLAKRSQVQRIKTGCKGFDALLGGGFDVFDGFAGPFFS